MMRMVYAAGRFAIVTLALVGLGGAVTTAQNTDLRLVEAARLDDIEAVNVLLKGGVSPRVSQLDGTTALHWAAVRDNLAMAGALIDAGASAGASNELGATPLWAAALNASPSMVRRLLAAGANPNASLALGETVLMTAARTGSADVVEQLLAKGADANAAGARGQTALMWAASQSHADVVRVLLKHKAEVGARSTVWTELLKTDPEQASHPEYQVRYKQGGHSALLFAARAGDLASARLLLDAGAEVNDRSAADISALVLAAHADHTALVSFLLDRGADANSDGAGYTALHAAILRGNAAAASALLAHGANPNAPVRSATPTRRESEDFFLHNTFIGATPFWLAARFGQPETMRLLAKAGADCEFVHNVDYPVGSYGVYNRLHEGATTTVMAALGMGGNIDSGYARPKSGRREAATLEAVRLAIELGADVTTANAHGTTALHRAATRGYNGVVQLLVERGAPLNALDRDGQTPLSAAVLAGNVSRRRGGDARPDTAAVNTRQSTIELLRKLGATE